MFWCYRMSCALTKATTKTKRNDNKTVEGFFNLGNVEQNYIMTNFFTTNNLDHGY